MPKSIRDLFLMRVVVDKIDRIVACIKHDCFEHFVEDELSRDAAEYGLTTIARIFSKELEKIPLLHVS